MGATPGEAPRRLLGHFNQPQLGPSRAQVVALFPSGVTRIIDSSTVAMTAMEPIPASPTPPPSAGAGEQQQQDMQAPIPHAVDGQGVIPVIPAMTIDESVTAVLTSASASDGAPYADSVGECDI